MFTVVHVLLSEICVIKLKNFFFVWLNSQVGKIDSLIQLHFLPSFATHKHNIQSSSNTSIDKILDQLNGNKQTNS